jgi:bifunctional DNA-binding transcriptional regulator/antitoxin component of YhaV-PrlF toxin-antitoxin module
MRVTTDAAGCLVIPAEILAEAGWPPDTEFEVNVREGKIAIEAAVPVGAAAAAGAGAGARGKGLSLVRGGMTDDDIARSVSERPRLDLLIRMAIAHRRIVDLVYDGRRKQVEPHDYGIRSGVPQLLVFQRSGESRSSDPTGWRSLKLSSISDFHVKEETFPGRRPADPDRRIVWDRLFTRVPE